MVIYKDSCYAISLYLNIQLLRQFQFSISFRP